MLFYKLLVSFQVWVVLRVYGSQEPNIVKRKTDFEKILFDVIYEYNQKPDSIIGQEFGGQIISMRSTRSISQEEFDRLELQFLYILKQMNDNYINQLPKEELGLIDIVSTFKNKFNIKIFPEWTICSYLPQCTDFILICAPTSSFTVAIMKCHQTLCNTIPDFIANMCTPTDVHRENYSCTRKNIDILRNKLKPLTNILKNDYSNVNNKDFKGTDFIEKVHKCVMNIDKIKMIKNNNKSPAINMEHTVAYEYTEHNAMDNTTKTYNEDKRKIFDEQIKDINTNMITAIEQNICDSSNELSNITNTNNTLRTASELLMIAFKNLHIYFRLNSYTFLSELVIKAKSLIDHDSIKDSMSKIFDSICAYVPLILFFLTENFIYNKFLYSYNLAYCGDILNYVYSRCPRVPNPFSGQILHDVNCIVESINYKILWDFFTISHALPEFNNSINKRCADIYTDFIKSFNAVIVELYNGFKIDVWTTFDWLSGKHFLTKEYKTNVGMDQLKESKYKLNNVTITLSDVYYLVLPLCADINFMCTIHNLIMFYLDRQLNEYVYRHAMTIIIYVERQLYNSGSNVENLHGSLYWYERIQILFDHYTNLPITRKRNKYIVRLIVEIETIKLAKAGNLRSNFPDDIFKEVHIWAQNKLAGNYANLNQLVVNNCLEAMEFFNIFMSIVKESIPSNSQIVTNDNLDDNNNNNTVNPFIENCLNLSNIFILKPPVSHSFKHILDCVSCKK